MGLALCHNLAESSSTSELYIVYKIHTLDSAEGGVIHRYRAKEYGRGSSMQPLNTHLSLHVYHLSLCMLVSKHLMNISSVMLETIVDLMKTG